MSNQKFPERSKPVDGVWAEVAKLKLLSEAETAENSTLELQ